MKRVPLLAVAVTVDDLGAVVTAGPCAVFDGADGVTMVVLLGAWAVVDGAAPGAGLADPWALVEADGEQGWPFACSTCPAAQGPDGGDGEADGAVTDGCDGEGERASGELCANAGALASTKAQAPANSRCFMACLRDWSTAR